MRIAVVSPAGMHDNPRLARSEALVASWGHELVHGRHTGARHRYTAGRQAERRADLAWALSAPGVDAVWFTRGGFGTAHLLPGLDLESVDDRLVMGFSDATVLLWALARAGTGQPVHGPVLHSLADHVDEESREAVRRLLAGEAPGPCWQGRHLVGPELPVEGPLLGGNLCMLATLAGTPWAFEAKGAIVVLEEVGEAPYRLDRLLTQLVQSGAFEGVRGVALGSFTGTSVPEGAAWTVEELLADLLAPLGVPVIAGLPVGHGARNQPWRLGTRVRLEGGGLHALPS